MMPVVCASYDLHPEEVAGKKSICTNAEKDVLHQYRRNLNQMKKSASRLASGTLVEERA